MTGSPSYDRDFFGWLNTNAQLMRNRQFDQIDVEHIAEELEGMARSEKRELLNRLAVLLVHLLKWQYQAPKRTGSRRNTIVMQRMDIADLIEDSPSLKPLVAEKMQAAYEKAKLKAEDETGIDRRSFPSQCPYTLEQSLSPEFFPGDHSDLA
ncbi:DUF29 domain-containing protein [Candidatus Thiodictyon syntrophicum]|jgi:hypothetical protein|uniref:DUF29 domain-containing protein n=1 Tax=Candidatus Thiodictyon syntrophicum TaxID=1166950 RepID=A0A2K8UDH9_9GAMM|nr:DUF29 domain-containing protein [Candidatus Thiodictyon syntrophicum]AUB83640.1 hypothetical protein THSYN_23605 [Candidatus Thiodictyon syntrophicum]